MLASTSDSFTIVERPSSSYLVPLSSSSSSSSSVRQRPSRSTARTPRHTRHGHQKHKDTTGVLCMVRNIDLVEALFFYGDDSVFCSSKSSIGTTTPAEDHNCDDVSLLPGVSSLMEECVRDDTAIIVLLDSFSKKYEQDKRRKRYEKKNQIIFESIPALNRKPNLIYVLQESVSAPNPADLYNCIHADYADGGGDDDDSTDGGSNGVKCITIQPKGFGGSSGFGTKSADPERPPLSRHCVVLCTTIEQCRAARAVGMRCVSLTDNDIADAVIGLGGDVIDEDDGWQSITMDDIATPGSFWLNVCHPRDDEGNTVDPMAIIKAYKTQKDSVLVRGENDRDDVLPNLFYRGSDDNTNEPSDDELAAILADIDPL